MSKPDWRITKWGLARATARIAARDARASLRDRSASLRWRLADGRTHASNAWYRAAGRRISGARTGISNARNRRAIDRGRASRIDGAIAAVTSRTPVVRGRINPATGRKRRDDAMMHRTRNEGLSRMKEHRPVTVGSQIERGLARIDAETREAQARARRSR